MARVSDGAGSTPRAWMSAMNELAGLAEQMYRELVHDNPALVAYFHAATPIAEIVCSASVEHAYIDGDAGEHQQANSQKQSGVIHCSRPPWRPRRP